MNRFKILKTSKLNPCFAPMEPTGAKMRKFEAGGKINFVDENNVFVGYDMDQDCCENAGWFVSKEKPKTILESPDFNFDEFVFDKDFFEESVLNREEVEDGGSVLFRLIGKDNSEAFLCLFNSHNGYYGHGFNMKLGGQEVHSGIL